MVYDVGLENWQREEREIQALMGIFEKFMHRIGKDAVHKNVRIRVLVSDSAKLNDTILAKIEEIERETEYCTGLQLSICVRYVFFVLCYDVRFFIVMVRDMKLLRQVHKLQRM